MKEVRCSCLQQGSCNTSAELKDLASDSLSLLKAAIYDERFPALFDLDVYGSIVGMFELNNLGVHPLACLNGTGRIVNETCFALAFLTQCCVIG